MRQIEELINNTKKYKEAILQKKLISKKNTVAYVILKGKPRVIKWYAPAYKRNIQIEYKILKKGFSEINIPTAFELDIQNNVIIMSYIIGENLCDLINSEKLTLNEKQRLIKLLSNWYIEFHSFYKTSDESIIRGDSNLRNFIFTDKIWGVDFEESRPGKIEEDIAAMSASILSTDPMFTNEKFVLCKTFIETYQKQSNLKIENTNEEIAYSLLRRIQWRPNDEDILRQYSNTIKKHGIIPKKTL